MDDETEIASEFTIGNYKKIRSYLDPFFPERSEWYEIVKVLKRRISERFFRPIRELSKFDKEDNLLFRPGAAILALDCLLIDTI